MQYNYTHDSPGLPGDVSAAAPRWLRLTRSGSTLTGYDSVNGTSWAKVGTARLAGLHATVQVGLFATSPVSFQRGSSGATTLATAVFDHVSGGNPAWRGHSIGASSMYPILEPGSYHRSGSTFTVSGSGDISPAVAGDIFGGDTLESILGGVLAGLIALIVVATLYITAEYRRGLIRVTLAASPRRGRVLAAKAIVIGAVTFATGLAATLIVIPISRHIQNGNGDYLFPVSPLTEMRVIIGTAAMLAVAAVAVLALGTVLRRSAGAVTAGIVLLVLPYILATALPGAGQWLMRLTPAAAFAVQQTIPAYPQVSDNYNVASGFYPLAPWAGFAVLCAWAALGPGPRLLPACGGETHDRAARRVDQAAHRRRHRLAPARRGRADHGGQHGRGRRHQVLPARLLPGHHQARADRHRPRPGRHRHRRRAHHQRRVQQRHDPRHPRRHAPPPPRACRQGRLGDRPGPGSWNRRRARLPARRPAPPVRPRLHPRPRLPALSLAHGPTLRAATGSVLYLALIALLSLGIATAVRDSAVAIGVVLAVLYLFPIIAQVLSPRWQHDVMRIGPMTAGLSIQATTHLAACPSAPGPASAWSPPGPPPPCSSAASSSASATPDRAAGRRRGRGPRSGNAASGICPMWSALGRVPAPARSHDSDATVELIVGPAQGTGRLGLDAGPHAICRPGDLGGAVQVTVRRRWRAGRALAGRPRACPGRVAVRGCARSWCRRGWWRWWCRRRAIAGSSPSGARRSGDEKYTKGSGCPGGSGRPGTGGSHDARDSGRAARCSRGRHSAGRA